MIQKFNRKTVSQIEGILYTGNNIDEIDAWMGQKHSIRNPESQYHSFDLPTPAIFIKAACGWMELSTGWYVVKMHGDFYVYSPTAMAKNYELAD